MSEKCEVCGSEKYFAGVASSGLGPMSFAFCQVCIRMNAETETMVNITIESCGGIDKVGVPLFYFDKKKDSYMDAKTGKIVPLKSNFNEKEFTTKSAWEHWWENDVLKIIDCPYCRKPVNIKDWNFEDPHPCMCCGEQFESNEIGDVRFMEKDW